MSWWPRAENEFLGGFLGTDDTQAVPLPTVVEDSSSSTICT